MTAADKKLIFAALILVFLSAAVFFGRSLAAVKHILVWKNGIKIAEIPLSRQGFFLLEDGVSIEIKENKVRVAQNNCAGHNCMQRGFISKSGEYIICAPKRIVIGFGGMSEKSASVDSVTY